MNGLSLRMASPDDAAALLAIYTPYVLNTCITFEYEVPSRQEFERRIRSVLDKRAYLVAQAHGEVHEKTVVERAPGANSDGEGTEIIGYAYLDDFNPRSAYAWSAQTAIYIAGKHRGAGIGKLLYTALERIALLQGITNLEACIAYPDEGGSVGFHEHLGYRLVGRFEQCGYKLGRWCDMVWMEKHIAPHDCPAASPLRFAQIRDAAEVVLADLNASVKQDRSL